MFGDCFPASAAETHNGLLSRLSTRWSGQSRPISMLQIEQVDDSPRLDEYHDSTSRTLPFWMRLERERGGTCTFSIVPFPEESEA
jgi:hypothetical protein